jgi:cobalt/nickel transport system permease protein
LSNIGAVLGGGHHHHGFLQSHAHGDSPIHRLPAGLKAFTAIALVIATVTVPLHQMTAVTFYPAVAFFLIAVAGLSLIPPGVIIRRVLLLEPVVLVAALLSLLQPGGGRIFLTLLIRSTLCMITMVLLANTTSSSDLISVMRRCRMPAILVTTIALMHRYLFLIVDQMHRMRRARAARTFAPTHIRQWRLIANTIGHLFVRTGDRAERIYVAMCARGWQ